jgi:hypothetical protein
LKPNTATLPLTGGPLDLELDLEPLLAAVARGGGAGGGGVFDGFSTLAFFAFVQLESDGLVGAAVPERATTETAKANEAQATSSSDGRSKTPMINRFLDHTRPLVR